ncbi:MAG TPA: hypothetical protein VJR47_02925 [Stellaceae bacterium]|nr:hypothetical protein [Stellaceae bacterium]
MRRRIATALTVFLLVQSQSPISPETPPPQRVPPYLPVPSNLPKPGPSPSFAPPPSVPGQFSPPPVPIPPSVNGNGIIGPGQPPGIPPGGLPGRGQ